MGDSDQPASGAWDTDESAPERLKLQLARPISPTLVDRLRQVPDSTANSTSPLGRRDLRRGSDLHLPSGQQVANYMGASDPDTIQRLMPLDKEVRDFSTDTPLWYYILAEAEGKGQLGTVGGQIVMETFLGVMLCDKTSLLSSWRQEETRPVWTPRAEWMTDGRFGMADLIYEARQWKKAAIV
jgi:hypothetical protein